MERHHDRFNEKPLSGRNVHLRCYDAYLSNWHRMRILHGHQNWPTKAMRAVIYAVLGGCCGARVQGSKQIYYVYVPVPVPANT